MRLKGDLAETSRRCDLTPENAALKSLCFFVSLVACVALAVCLPRLARGSLSDVCSQLRS